MLFNLLWNVLASELCKSNASSGLQCLKTLQVTTNNGFWLSFIIWRYHFCFYSGSPFERHFTPVTIGHLNLWSCRIAEGVCGNPYQDTQQRKLQYHTVPRRRISRHHTVPRRRISGHEPECGFVSHLLTQPSSGYTSRHVCEQKLGWNTNSSVFLSEAGWWVREGHASLHSSPKRTLTAKQTKGSKWRRKTKKAQSLWIYPEDATQDAAECNNNCLLIFIGQCFKPTTEYQQQHFDEGTFSLVPFHRWRNQGKGRLSPCPSWSLSWHLGYWHCLSVLA